MNRPESDPALLTRTGPAVCNNGTGAEGHGGSRGKQPEAISAGALQSVTRSPVWNAEQPLDARGWATTGSSCINELKLFGATVSLIINSIVIPAFRGLRVRNHLRLGSAGTPARPSAKQP